MSQTTVPQRNRRYLKFGLAAIVALIVVVAGITTVVLSQSQSNSRRKTARQAPSTTKHYVATKEIVFDQATNSLRKPTTEETNAMVAQISSLTNRTSEGLTARTLSNGTKQVTLEGRFGGVVIGRARADGTTEARCVMTLEEAVDFLGLEEVTE